MDKVELKPYNAEWASEFQKEKARLKQILSTQVLAIEHVGSTAIPGLSAKPVLDIAVAVKNENTLRELIPVMSEHGYDVLDSIERCGEILARKGSPEYRTHYIHIEVMGSTYWNNHIVFRDYLLGHPELITEYEDLKKRIAEEHKEERKKYTAAKEAFIRRVLSLAETEKQ